MESEGVPRIPRNGDRSGRRRGEVRVSENTPVADRSVWRSVDVSTPRLAGGGKSPRSELVVVAVISSEESCLCYLYTAACQA